MEIERKYLVQKLPEDLDSFPFRELEQGKETVRMDKVNAALAMFDMEAVPGRKDDK